MSEWKKVKLDDCLELITYGFTNPMPDTLNGPWKVTAKDINNGRIVFETARHTSQEAFDNDLTDKSRPKKGDILLTKDGTLGRLAIVGDERICINQSVALLRVNNDILSVPYLYYLLSTPLYQAKMLADAGGAAIKHIYITRVNQLLIPCPSYDEQCRIANILSRYDSLIENYQKQIKLLEEAAQRLYKEWFVDFHFPGYENAMIVDGVPEGWEKKKVGDMISKIQRTKQVTTNNYQASGKIPVIDQSRNYIAGYTDDAECLVKVTVPYIVFGDHTRILKYIPFSFAKGADGTQLIMSNDLERMPQTLFYNSLIEIDLSNYSYARHFKYLKEEFVLLPSEYIARKYDSIVSRYYQSIQKSREQIRLLTEARDRLLPKLMNGEIKV